MANGESGMVVVREASLADQQQPERTVEESVSPLNQIETEGSRSESGRGRDRRARVTSPHRSALLSGAHPDDLPMGSKVGRYVFSRLLGRGAMGVVYAAYDPDLDRRIAIKVLGDRLPGPSTPDTAGADTAALDRSEGRRLRLMREAQSMAAFSHPNVVRIHGAGVQEGRVYIAMEFVAGDSLREWLNLRARPWNEVLPVFIQAGRGLAAAHDAGLVHRDFKPDNVMVTEQSGAKVGDFGLARAVRGDGDDAGPGGDEAIAQARAVARRSGLSRGRALEADLTRTGAAVGTPAYMSPEQHAALPLDPRSDQFSFCVTLYEALYGRRPYERRTVQEIARAKAQDQPAEPPRGSAVPSTVFDVIRRGLRAKPEARYTSMHALVEALERELVARPRRRIWLSIGAAAAGIAALGLVFGLVEPVGDSDPCPALDDALAEVWGVELIQRVSTRIEAAGIPFPDAVARRFRDAADDYARSWGEARVEACEQVKVLHAHDDKWLDAAMVCLDRRRASADQLLAALDAAPDESVPAVLGRLDEFPPPRGCLARAERDRGAAAGGERPVPEDPERAIKVARLRAELEEVRGQRRLGVRGPARDRAKQLANEARTLGFAPLVAESLLVLAGVQPGDEAGTARRITMLHQAAQASLSAGDEEGLARAWVELADAYTRNGQLEAAERWLLYARRMVSRNPTPELQAELAGAEVWQAILSNEVARANAAAQRELEIVERDFGPRHPRVIPALNHLGIAAYYDHRKDDAIAHYRKALSIGEARHGPSSPEVSPMLNNIGVVLTDLGRYAEAVTYYERSLEIRRLNLAADDPSLLQAYDNLAELLVRDEQWPRALPYCQKAVELLPGEGLGGDHFKAWTRLGKAARHAGEVDEAIEVLVAALERSQSDEDVSREQLRWRGRLQFELAKAYAAANQRSNARSAAEGAVGDMSVSGAKAEKLEEIRRWSAKNAR